MTAFTINRATKDGLAHYCRLCDRQYRIKKRAANPELYKSHHYKARYGVDLNWYNQAFASQQGRCATCNKHQTELKQRLCIDHNHKTGQVRRLLCDPCNKAVGLIKENPETAISIAAYLRKF